MTKEQMIITAYIGTLAALPLTRTMSAAMPWLLSIGAYPAFWALSCWSRPQVLHWAALLLVFPLGSCGILLLILPAEQYLIGERSLSSLVLGYLLLCPTFWVICRTNLQALESDNEEHKII